MRLFLLVAILSADLVSLAAALSPALALDDVQAGIAHFVVAFVNVVAIASLWPRFRSLAVPAVVA